MDLMDHEDMLPLDEEEDGREDVRDGVLQLENVEHRHLGHDDTDSEVEDDDENGAAEEDSDVDLDGEGGSTGSLSAGDIFRSPKVCERSAESAVSTRSTRFRFPAPDLRTSKARAVDGH